ncbi:MAG: Mu-like prophage major head subunit gpT family protein [Panacagrimonas sp.]
MIINRSNLADLFVGYQARFNDGFRGVPADWSMIAESVPSSTSEEHYAWLGDWPGLREWIGERYIKQLQSHDYRIKNRKFESTVGVDRDAIEDDRYGVYAPRMKFMGQAAARHPNRMVFDLLKNGFSTPCFDGQFYFDSDHPVEINGVATSVSNVQAGGGEPWFLIDSSTALKPIIWQTRRDYAFRQMTDLNDAQVFMTDKFLFGVDARVNAGFGFWQVAFGSKAALDATNFNAAMAAMMVGRSSEGELLGIKPTHLVVGPANRSAALNVLKEYDNAGANNINYKAVELLITPWLA